MAFVLISKTISTNLINYNNIQILEHTFNKGSLKSWIERSNTNTSNSTTIDSTISLLNNFYSWAGTQPGFQYHLKGVTDDYVLEDVYVFNTKANGDMFKHSMKTNVYFIAILTYYTKNGITQNWIELN